MTSAQMISGPLRTIDQVRTAGATHLSGDDWARLWFGETASSVAGGVFVLLADEPAWVERRVERIDVLDRARVRRHMSIDFRLPKELVRFAADDGERAPDAAPSILIEAGLPVPLPLGLFKKEPLRAFDIRDENGRPLIVWTREQNVPVTAALLLKLAGDVAGQQGVLMSRSVAYDIRCIAGTATDSLADAAWARLERPNDADPDADLRRAIFDEGVARAFFEELRDQFILIADVDGPLDRRRLVKISAEHALSSDRQPDGGGVARALGKRTRDLLETVGWATFRVGFPAPALADAGSYHVEIAAPDDVFIARASLIVGTRDEREFEVASETGQERAHLFTGRDRARWGGWSLDDVAWSEVDVRFSLRPGGLVTAAALTSALTTALLWIGLALHRHHISPRPEAATAVLVVLPALYAAYIAPGRDPLLRRMSGALRILVLATCLIAFAAASALAVDMTPKDVTALWSGLRWGSLGITSVLTVSFVMTLGRHLYSHRPKNPR